MGILYHGTFHYCPHYSDATWVPWYLKSPDQRSLLLALCEGNPLVTGGFPSQKASNAEIFSLSWHHHDNNKPCSIPVLLFLPARLLIDQNSFDVPHITSWRYVIVATQGLVTRNNMHCCMVTGITYTKLFWSYHVPQLISPWKKWPPFCRRYFQMQFREWKVLYFD